eukprot:scaffold465667_cov45-Prasinocladus_malaysianus.AAC.1
MCWAADSLFQQRERAAFGSGSTWSPSVLQLCAGGQQAQSALRGEEVRGQQGQGGREGYGRDRDLHGAGPGERSQDKEKDATGNLKIRRFTQHANKIAIFYFIFFDVEILQAEI